MDLNFKNLPNITNTSNVENIVNALAGLVGGENLKLGEPMKHHTSFMVGGPADVFVMPDSLTELVRTYEICREAQIPVFVMGNGTNLVVGDRGIRGVVVKLAENIGKYEIADDVITAEAGIPIARLSRIALDHSLSGLEFAEGIPGTLGGAVTMNAGAYTGEMSDIVLSTEYLDGSGRMITLDRERHMFGKRVSFIQTDGGIALRTRMKLKKGVKSGIKAAMDDFCRQRRTKQPLDMPSAGSIFKRPEGYFTGKLIQDCGLKGFRIRGAQVSDVHCGFIVNTGGATARDITELIRYIQDAVRKRFGVELQTEVKIVGDE